VSKLNKNIIIQTPKAAFHEKIKLVAKQKFITAILKKNKPAVKKKLNIQIQIYPKIHININFNVSIY